MCNGREGRRPGPERRCRAGVTGATSARRRTRCWRTLAPPPSRRGRGFVDRTNTLGRDQQRGNRERYKTGAAEKLSLGVMSTDRLPALHLFCVRRPWLAVGSVGRLGSMEGRRGREGLGRGLWISLIFSYIKVTTLTHQLQKRRTKSHENTEGKKQRGHSTGKQKQRTASTSH